MSKYRLAKNMFVITYITFDELKDYLEEGSKLTGIPINKIAFPIVQSVPIKQDESGDEEDDLTGDITDFN